MSFKVKITITDNGNRPNNSTFTLYGDLDNYETPIASDITKLELTDPLIPYIVDVPDGTTFLRLFDDFNGCFVEFEITEDNFCEEANFTFSSADTQLIGRIDVGDLLSNNNSLTDYRIFWYNENQQNKSKLQSNSLKMTSQGSEEKSLY